MKKTIRVLSSGFYLVCPDCRTKLTGSGVRLCCGGCGRNFPVHRGIADFSSVSASPDGLSAAKWDDYYRSEDNLKKYSENRRQYLDRYFKDTYGQLNKAKSVRESVYLEIGCGEFILGQALASQCRLVIGIDMSQSALETAELSLRQQGVRNYLLIRGDISRFPLRSGSVDLVYGGGVIEHLRDPAPCLGEIYRVLKKDGVSFNTVPLLNLGSLTYRQVWGNIPNLPVLKKFYEFIHLTVFKGRHMTYGYELSYRPSDMIKLHRNAGFENVTVNRFDVKLTFEFIPEIFRPALRVLAEKSPLFWPMMKVIARKMVT